LRWAPALLGHQWLRPQPAQRSACGTSACFQYDRRYCRVVRLTTRLEDAPGIRYVWPVDEHGGVAGQRLNHRSVSSGTPDAEADPAGRHVATRRSSPPASPRTLRPRPRGRWCCPRGWSGTSQKSQCQGITPTIGTIVATRNPIIGVVGQGLTDQAELTHPRAVGSDVGPSGRMWGAPESSQ